MKTQSELFKWEVNVVKNYYGYNSIELARAHAEKFAQIARDEKKEAPYLHTHENQRVRLLFPDGVGVDFNLSKFHSGERLKLAEGDRPRQIDSVDLHDHEVLSDVSKTWRCKQIADIDRTLKSILGESVRDVKKSTKTQRIYERINR